MIAAVGDLVEDIVVWTREPYHPHTDTPAQVHRRRGGSAANVVSLVAREGGAARFIGSVGVDTIGEHLLHSLVADGVDLAVQRTGTTGSLIVVVTPDGERSFFTDRGAATQLTQSEPTWLDEVRVLHVPGYSFWPPPLSVSARGLLDAALDRELRISIDASSTAIISRLGTTAVLDTLAELHVNVVFANRDEARLLGLAPGSPAPNATTTIVRDGGIETHVVDRYGNTTTVPVPPVDQVLDTTGAGDAFAAGWLLATEQGASAVEAVEAAHALAARIISQPGAELGHDEP